MINLSVDTEGLWSITLVGGGGLPNVLKSPILSLFSSRISAGANNCRPVKLSIAPVPSSSPESSSVKIFTSGGSMYIS
jgi:hypothetical protein